MDDRLGRSGVHKTRSINGSNAQQPARGFVKCEIRSVAFKCLKAKQTDRQCRLSERLTAVGYRPSMPATDTLAGSNDHELILLTPFQADRQEIDGPDRVSALRQDHRAPSHLF